MDCYFEDFNYGIIINTHILNLTKFQSKKKDNVTIYELNGEDFILLVHTMINRRCEDDIKWSSTQDLKNYRQL